MALVEARMYILRVMPSTNWYTLVEWMAVNVYHRDASVIEGFSGNRTPPLIHTEWPSRMYISASYAFHYHLVEA